MKISLARHGAIAITPGKPGRLEISGYGLKTLNVQWAKVLSLSVSRGDNDMLYVNGEGYPGLADVYHKVSGELTRQRSKTRGV